MKYREALCESCDWTHIVPALPPELALQPGFTDGLENFIESHIAPTRVPVASGPTKGLSWPHKVYVIEVHQ